MLRQLPLNAMRFEISSINVKAFRLSCGGSLFKMTLNEELMSGLQHAQPPQPHLQKRRFSMFTPLRIFLPEMKKVKGAFFRTCRHI